MTALDSFNNPLSTQEYLARFGVDETGFIVTDAQDKSTESYLQESGLINIYPKDYLEQYKISKSSDIVVVNQAELRLIK